MGRGQCTLKSSHWLVGIIDWSSRAGLQAVAQVYRTCKATALARARSGGGEHLAPCGFRDELVERLADNRGRGAAPPRRLDLGIPRVMCVFDPAIRIAVRCATACGIVADFASAVDDDQYNLPLMNTITGPPVNLAITPDRHLALVANSLDWVKDGYGWKGMPDAHAAILADSSMA
jgi:hypothetical protein